MAFTPDLTIKDFSDADVVFSYLGTTGTKTVRKDNTRDLDSPRVMTVSHETSGKGSSAVDRHLIRFDQTEVDDSDDSSISTGSAHIVLTVPRANITSDHMKDLIDFLINYLAVEANVDKILSGTPG